LSIASTEYFEPVVRGYIVNFLGLVFGYGWDVCRSEEFGCTGEVMEFELRRTELGNFAVEVLGLEVGEC
jgi:hypothetical protein